MRDFEHVPILAFRAVLRLAVDRKALKLRLNHVVLFMTDS